MSAMPPSVRSGFDDKSNRSSRRGLCTHLEIAVTSASLTPLDARFKWSRSSDPGRNVSSYVTDVSGTSAGSFHLFSDVDVRTASLRC